MPDDAAGDTADLPASPHEALSALAEGPGATVEEIASPAGRALLDLAEIPPQWPRDVQARAVRTVLNEVVESLRDARHRETARARLGLAPQYSSHDPARRMEKLLESGVLDPSHNDPSHNLGHAQEWPDIRAALAGMLEDRLLQLNAAQGWRQYAGGYTPLEESEASQPFKFDSYHMLFTLSGRVGIECTTYRVIRALADGVDSYRAVAWYYSDPEANVEILPVANCKVGSLVSLEKGGSAARLELPQPLLRGESCFFASKVIYHSRRDSTRIVSHEVRSQLVDKLTIGIQFDVSSPPASVWHYSGSREVGTKRPRQGSSDFLPVSRLGFASYEFTDCENGRRYGVQWDWNRRPGRSVPPSSLKEGEGTVGDA